MGMTSPGPARTALTLGLCLAAAASVVYVITRDRGERDSAARPAASPVATAPHALPGPETAAQPEPETAASPDAGAPGEQPAAADKAGSAASPSIDVVRVAPDGATVVAGRTTPGAKVTIYAESEKIAEADADAGGNFVALFDAKPSAEPRALTLGSETADGEKTVSDQVVVLLPEAPAASPPVKTGPAKTEARAAGPAETATADAPAPEAAASTEVAATAILSLESVEITPLARPTGAAANRVSLASISYADAGEVTLAGFGLAGAQLRAYVDDGFARDGAVDANGRWTIALGDVTAGVYRLRIDQLGADGKVSSRIETPFQRDFPQPRPASETGPGRVSVIVQPGNNLWTLARIHYGSGVLYTQIFTANSDLIGDANLIYPGQIFRLPEKHATE